MERTHYCGTLRRTHIGLQATVCGWVLTCRDMGGVIFVDVRDREGVVQTVFDQAVADPGQLCAGRTAQKPERGADHRRGAPARRKHL